MAFNYLATQVTIFATASGYAAGDFAKVYSNDGSGSVDTTAAHDSNTYDLNVSFPNNELAVMLSVRVYGWWLFQIWTFDAAGNKHSGTPDEEGIWPLLTPVKANRPKIETWNNTTKALTLSRSS